MNKDSVAEMSQQYQVEAAQKLVPEGYKQTEVGVIPEDWDVVYIGDVCELLTGFPFPSKSYSSSGVRLLRGSNVKRNTTDWNDAITQYWPAIDASIKQYELKAGDIVIAMDGSLVGRSFAQLNKSDLPAILLQRVARVRSNVASQNYIKEWICSSFFTEHCDSVKTVTAIPHISPDDIKSFRFLLPRTKKEQENIANALSDTDALLSELEKLIAKKQAIKTATMQQLLTGRTRLPQFANHSDGSKKGYKQSELGEIPEDWIIAAIADQHEIATGNTPPTSDIRNYGGNYLFVSPADLGNKKCIDKAEKTLSNKGFALARKFPAGSTLFTCIGSTIGKTGYATVDLTSNQQINAVFPNENHDSNFTYYALTYIAPKIKVLAGEQAVPLVNKTAFGQTLYYLPKKKQEQTAIATILSDMDEEIQALEQRFNKTRQIKQGMMQQLLTGKVRLV